MPTTLLALPPPVVGSSINRWGIFFVTTYKCPCCGSSNTAIGIAPGSTNVLLVCNACNFRDVVYYGDSYADAYLFFAALRRPRPAVKMRVTRTSLRELSAMRPFKGVRALAGRRWEGVSVPYLQLRLDCWHVKNPCQKRYSVVFASLR